MTAWRVPRLRLPRVESERILYARGYRRVGGDPLSEAQAVRIAVNSGQRVGGAAQRQLLRAVRLRCPDALACGATRAFDPPTSEKEDAGERNHRGQRSGVRGSRRARHARAVRPARGSRHRPDDLDRAGTPPQRADGDGARAHRRPRPSRERATGVRPVCKRQQPSTREPSRSAARPCQPTSTDASSGSDSTTGRSCEQRTGWPSCG